MLVLGRQVGEVLFIGDNIQVQILKIDKDRVELGITAPSHVRVDREEIHELRKQRDHK